MKNLLLALLVMAFLMPMCIFAQEKLIFVCEEYPPYEYQEGGMAKGMDVEIITEACKRAQINFEIRFQPWVRCVADVKTGNADGVFGLLKNVDRESFLLYPSTPLVYDNMVIFSLNSFKGNVSKIEDLKGLKIGIVRGYSYGKKFDNFKNFERDIATGSEQMFKKFQGARYELCASNEAVGVYTLKKIGFSDYKIQQYIITTNPLYLGFSKVSPKAKANFSKFDDALKTMNTDGTLAKIRKKYGV